MAVVSWTFHVCARGADGARAPAGYFVDAPARPSGAGGFWTVDYYQPFFDVDTKTVRPPLFPP
jgi:hypothetical protein